MTRVGSQRHSKKKKYIYIYTHTHTYIHILLPALTLNKSEFSTERTHMLCITLNNPKQQYPYTISFYNEHVVFM